MQRILVLYSLLASTLLQAQNVNVTYSGKFNLLDKGVIGKTGGMWRVGDYYYSMETDYDGKDPKNKSPDYDINLYKFDSAFRQVGKVAVEGQYSLGPLPPVPGVWFAGRLLVFYYKESDKGDIRLLFSAVDPETMAVSPAKELDVVSRKNTGMINIDRSDDLNGVNIAVNPDSSKLLVVQSGSANVFCSVVIEKDLSFGKPVVSTVRDDLRGFKINAVGVDAAGNKYVTYNYVEKGKDHHGLMLQRATGKDVWPELRIPDDVTNAGLLWLRPSRDNSKVFVYGIAKGDMRMEWEIGILVATVDVANLQVGNVKFFPYPDELRQNLYKMDYAERSHGNLEVKNAFYVSNELEDGTLALTGYPEDIERGAMMTNIDGSMRQSASIYAGPIINVFIKNGKASFGVIYRNQVMSQASMFVAVPYNDKLVCIYNDVEKSITSDDLHVNGKRSEMKELVLAAAVISSDGKVISRKKVADKQGNLVFLTSFLQILLPKDFLLPLGQLKAGFTAPYMKFGQWAMLRVQ